MPAAEDTNQRRAKLDELAKRAAHDRPLFNERPNAEACPAPAGEQPDTPPSTSRPQSRGTAMKTPPHEPDPVQAIRDVQTVADAFFGEHAGGTFVIHTAEGKDVTLPIPARVPLAPPGPAGLAEFLALARAVCVAGGPASVEAAAGGLRFRFDVERVAGDADGREANPDA